MFVMVNEEDETFEWHNEEDVETDGLLVPKETTTAHGTPILSQALGNLGRNLIMSVKNIYFLIFEVH